jgi:hypothetical protein
MFHIVKEPSPDDSLVNIKNPNGQSKKRAIVIRKVGERDAF